MRAKCEVDGVRRASIRDDVRRFLSRHKFTGSDTRFSSVTEIYALYLADAGDPHSEALEERFRSALGRVLRPPKAAGAWAMRWAVPRLQRRRGYISIVSPSVANVDPQEEYMKGKALLGQRLRIAATTCGDVAALRKEREQRKLSGVVPDTEGPPLRVSFRYVDEFMALACAPDLCKIRVFPNGKELAESMAAFAAVREHVRGDGGDDVLAFGSRNIVLVAVGDGSTPRTASLFAFRTAWRCVSIDPALKTAGKWRDVSSLTLVKSRAQDVQVLVEKHERVVLIMWHAHVSVKDAIKCLGFAGGEQATRERVALIACHCCNFDKRQRFMLGDAPDIEYEEDGMPGLMRSVRVWKFKKAATVME